MKPRAVTVSAPTVLTIRAAEKPAEVLAERTERRRGASVAVPKPPPSSEPLFRLWLGQAG